MGELKLLSLTPVTKVFLDEPVREADARERFEGFQNETISFQLAFCGTLETARKCVYLEAASPLKEHLRIRAVQSVPVHLATLPDADDNYLRKTPGLYPDLLRDQKPGDRMGSLRVQPGQWHAYFIDVEPNGACAPGEYPVELRLRDANEEAVYATATVTIRILPGMLPAQKLIRTHWFHCDCLANYYRVPVFSEEHWRLLENFVRLAARRGCTMLLTPLFTPPLDTAKGGERTTVQLVDVRAENGAYSFGFERLERWVEMCERCGVTYYELSHLFSQWGAVAAPKIVATVDGEEKKLFGWHTDARGAEYAAFLKAFLTALMKELHRLQIADRAYFHISDEPVLEQMEDYRHAKSLDTPYIEGRPIVDALSDFAFYQTGAVEKPIVSINHMAPFLEAEVPGLWTYYCIGQYKDVVNTFIAMPGQRTRMLGMLLYKFDIEGFLHWGFNFYNSQGSTRPINPWFDTDCDGFAQAGDGFQVYPGRGGQPVDSIRLMLVQQALQDQRAMQLLESLSDRETVLKLIDEGVEPITFSKYPHDDAYVLGLREKINREIEKRL